MKLCVNLTLSLCVCAIAGNAAELTTAAATAFDRYVADFEIHRLRATVSPMDEARRERLMDGDVMIRPGRNNGETPVDSGLIHDWIGEIFIPGKTMDRTLRMIQDYSRDGEIYWPDIAEVKVRSRRGNEDFAIYRRIVKSKMLITDVLNTEHEIHFTRVSPTRAYCRSYSTRIAEVSKPGTEKERELPVGKDRGFLWRMDGYWFFEERDGGVFIESESITLSRDIPFGMAKILGPILHDVPGESLRASLERTRRALVGGVALSSD